MAAKKQELGVVVGVLVLTKQGVLVADTDTATRLSEGDYVKVNLVERRARYADNLDNNDDTRQYETARLLASQLPEARRQIANKRGAA